VRIARYGRSPTENQKRQAYVPSGSLVINNPVGTAPAFILKVPSPLKVDKTHRAMEKVVICLPGVPKEMETLLLDSVVPFLQQQFSLHDLIFVRTLHVSGLGEGMIDDLIGDLEILSNPTVGLTAHSGIVDIRMATKAGNEIEARRQVEKVEMDLRSRLGESIFGADEDTLEGVVLEAIAEQYLTLAVYEIGLGSALIDRLSRSKSTAYKGGSNFDPVCP
jgi:nicotinamide-nucleotide amidase